MNNLRLAYGINLFLVALLAGGWLFERLGLDPAMHVLSGPAFAELKPLLDEGIGPIMKVVFPVTILVHAWVLYLKRKEMNSLSFKLTAVGLLCIIGIAASTLIINVPINNQTINWTPDTLPANWEELRDRWLFGHTIRRWLSGVMLLAAIVSVVSEIPKGKE
jgi:hypothetical protein